MQVYLSVRLRSVGPWQVASALLSVCLILGMAALPAAAQGTTPALEEATLRLSPEYDDPGLLVILTGSFNSDTRLPIQASFPVPQAARGLQATEQDPSQSLLTREWTRQADQISYTLQAQPGFQVEYYLDRQPSGNDRVVQFSWRAPYDIKSLTIVTQQPQRASNFSMVPKADSSFQSGDGLTSYQVKRSDVKAGDNFNITVRYTKSDAAPSFQRSQSANTSGAAAPVPTAPASQPQNFLPYILIAVGVAALAGALVYWIMEQRQASRPAARRERSERRTVAAGSKPRSAIAGRPALDDDTRFCPKCGRPYAPGDRFCGQCGAPR